MAPTLGTLPAELVIHIAHQADRKDLLAFRLVSKDICAATEEAFIAAFFTIRHHLLTVHSLEVLVSITESSHLISGLRAISLTTPVFELPHGVVLVQGDTIEKKTQRELDRERVWEKWMKVRQAFMEDGRGFDLLTRSLGSLKRARITPRISLDPNWRKGYKPWHMDQLDNQTPGRHLGLTFGLLTVNESTAGLIRAIAHTKFPMVELSIPSPGGIITTSSCCPVDTVNFKNLQWCFSWLDTLQMKFHFGTHTSPDHMNDLSTLIRKSTSLKAVSLEICDYRTSGLGALPQILAVCGLIKIRLSGLRGHFTQIYALLQPHVTRLRRLYLEDVSIEHNESPREVGMVLSWIAQNTNLIEVVFSGGVSRSFGYRWSAKENVKEQLEALSKIDFFQREKFSWSD